MTPAAHAPRPRVLMLGNSYTTSRELPARVARLASAEVTVHARGGARLAEQLNPRTRLGALTAEALAAGGWDFVVLQEMSNGPVLHRAAFDRSVDALCEKVLSSGARPVLYATWAYAAGGRTLARSGLDHDAMYRALHEAYAAAAERNDAILADVGTAFFRSADEPVLFSSDGSHPSDAGAELAADVIAEALLHA